jgi:hypothetical protein
MIRTQIQLEETQLRRLRALAAREGRSVADLIRESVDGLLRSDGGRDPEEIRRRALALAGQFRSGLGDLATDHDRYVEEAFGS